MRAVAIQGQHLPSLWRRRGRRKFRRKRRGRRTFRRQRRGEGDVAEGEEDVPKEESLE